MPARAGTVLAKLAAGHELRHDDLSPAAQSEPYANAIFAPNPDPYSEALAHLHADEHVDDVAHAVCHQRHLALSYAIALSNQHDVALSVSVAHAVALAHQFDHANPQPKRFTVAHADNDDDVTDQFPDVAHDVVFHDHDPFSTPRITALTTFDNRSRTYYTSEEICNLANPWSASAGLFATAGASLEPHHETPIHDPKTTSPGGR